MISNVIKSSHHYFNKINYFGGQVFVVLLCVFSYATFKYLGAYNSISHFSVGTAVLMMTLVLGWNIKLSEQTQAVRILIRTIGITFIIYLLTASPSFSIDTISTFSPQDQFYIRYLPYIILVESLLFFYRPIFIIALMGNIIYHKLLITNVYSIPLSSTDYYTLIEFTSFIMIGLILIYWLKKFKVIQDNIPNTYIDGNTLSSKINYTDIIVLSALAVHLSNYLYSAVEKLRLGQYPWDWLRYNNTHNIVLNAHASENLPLLFNETMTYYLHFIMSYAYHLTNPMILLGQLFALFALKSIRWLILITLFYDLTHIVIYLTSGIFFWK